MRARPARSACVLVTSRPRCHQRRHRPSPTPYMDSIPLVCITGQVPTHLIGSDAFQECDTTGITRHLHEAQLPRAAHRGPAAHPARGLLGRLARPPRPGRDRRSRRTCSSRPAAMSAHRTSSTRPIIPKFKGDLDKIRHADRPDGGRQSARSSIRAAASSTPGRRRRRCCANSSALTNFPITSTLMGLGAYPASGKNWLGMLGMHGTYEANHTMHDCDLMIAVGAPLRRPHHGAARCLLAGLDEDPHRYRSVLDPTRSSRSISASSATAASCSRIWCGCGGPSGPCDDRYGGDSACGGERIEGWRRRNSLALRPVAGRRSSRSTR